MQCYWVMREWVSTWDRGPSKRLERILKFTKSSLTKIIDADSLRDGMKTP